LAPGDREGALVLEQFFPRRAEGRQALGPARLARRGLGPSGPEPRVVRRDAGLERSEFRIRGRARRLGQRTIFVGSLFQRRLRRFDRLSARGEILLTDET